MRDARQTPEGALEEYFRALTSGDMLAIQECVDDDFDVRIDAGRDEDLAARFEHALERYLHLSEETEGFRIATEALDVRASEPDAWFEGIQRWEVNWDGKITRMRVVVAGTLSMGQAGWKLVQLHAAPERA